MTPSAALLAFPAPDRNGRSLRAERGSSTASRASAPSQSRDHPLPPPPLLRANGVLAQISYAGQHGQLASSPGLRCLSALVAEPGEEIPALILEQQWLVDLAAPAGGRCAPHDARLRARDAVREAVVAALDALAAVHPAAAAHLQAHVHLDWLCRYDPGVAGGAGPDPVGF